jgi:hypothetical protein
VATRKKSTRTSPRSKKAGRPPQPSAPPKRVRRRQKSATAAVRKDTTLVQTEKDPRARWSGAKPTWRKR